MNPDQKSLWQRIQAHALDDSRAVCPFSARLAKENAWPPGFTQRAIEEYRRFAFLAVAAGHPVSPSDAVDQVWHLHLLYTRDYWGEFCPNVLRTPLHHGPTRGGAVEHDKFADWYARTLASYRKFFGEPPAEFWPQPAVHPETTRVDRARFWVIEKPRWIARVRAWLRGGPGDMQRAAPTTAGAPADAESPERLPTALRPGGSVTSAVVVALAACAATPQRVFAAASPEGWPFNLTGPQFLQFYALLGVAALGLALWLRWYLRLPATPLAGGEKVDGYEAAFMASGPAGAFSAGLVGAAHRQLIEVSGGKVRRTATPLPENLPLIERAICGAAGPIGTRLPVVRAAARSAVEAIHAGLAERGLALGDREARRARTTPALVLASVLFIGAVKVKIGLSLGRPVGFLIAMLIAGTIVTLCFLRRPRLSRRGSQALEDLRAEHHDLVSTNRLALRGSDAAFLLPLAVGLYGTSALYGTPLDAMRKELKPVFDASGGTSATGCGSSCGGGGGDSGGGGGGGGGDGGGGGGCGGCGGGGGD